MIVNESKKILKKKFTIFKFWINFQYLLKVITLAEKNIASGVSDSSVEQMDKLLFLLLHKLDNLEKENVFIAFFDSTPIADSMSDMVLKLCIPRAQYRVVLYTVHENLSFICQPGRQPFNKDCVVNILPSYKQFVQSVYRNIPKNLEELLKIFSVSSLELSETSERNFKRSTYNLRFAVIKNYLFIICRRLVFSTGDEDIKSLIYRVTNPLFPSCENNFTCHRTRLLFNCRDSRELNTIVKEFQELMKLFYTDKPKDVSDSREYTSEVMQVFNRFTSLPNFTGVAIRGYDQTDANRTFQIDVKKFEIDWTFVSSSGACIVEVGSAGNPDNPKSIIDAKVKQVVERSSVYIKKMILGSECLSMHKFVNYVVALPNVSLLNLKSLMNDMVRKYGAESIEEVVFQEVVSKKLQCLQRGVLWTPDGRYGNCLPIV